MAPPTYARRPAHTPTACLLTAVPPASYPPLPCRRRLTGWMRTTGRCGRPCRPGCRERRRRWPGCGRQPPRSELQGQNPKPFCPGAAQEAWPGLGGPRQPGSNTVAAALQWRKYVSPGQLTQGSPSAPLPRRPQCTAPIRLFRLVSGSVCHSCITTRTPASSLRLHSGNCHHQSMQHPYIGVPVRCRPCGMATRSREQSAQHDQRGGGTQKKTGAARCHKPLACVSACRGQRYMRGATAAGAQAAAGVHVGSQRAYVVRTALIIQDNEAYARLAEAFGMACKGVHSYRQCPLECALPLPPCPADAGAQWASCSGRAGQRLLRPSAWSLQNRG